MLFHDDVKPLLLRESRAVRNLAADYFKDSWSTDPELALLVVEACRRFGAAEAAHLLVAAQRFVFTPESWRLFFDLANETSDRNSQFHIEQALASAPWVAELVRENESLGDITLLDSASQKCIERRRELSRWSGAQLWAELQDFAARSAAARYVEDIDYGYVSDLVECLADKDEPAGAAICEGIRSTDVEHNGWLQTFLVDLAGARRLKEAVPVLVDLFRIDTDFLLERSMYALGRIGDVEAVRLVKSAWPNESWHFKNFAANVFAYIKSPESEEALLALLETETDLEIRTELCFCLCKQFSERGVEAVLRQIRDGYDEFRACLKDEVVPVAEALGIELPERAAWLEEKAEEKRQHKEWLENLGRPKGRLPPSPRSEQQPPASPLVTDERHEPGLVGTIRRESRKVGRNEPCPCGSGKKFKKCCGRQ